MSVIDNELDKIHGTIGLPRTPDESMRLKYSSYNIHRRPDVNLVGGLGRSYVFIERPKLSLFDGNGEIFRGLYGDMELVNLLESDPVLYGLLDGDHLKENSTGLLYPLMNDIISFVPAKASFVNKVTAANRRGFRVEIPSDYEESMMNIPIPMNFNNDKYLSTFRLIDFWIKYISSSTRGKIYPKPKIDVMNVFEGASRMFHIITAEDGESILYWGEYPGLYPNDMPYDSFSHDRKVDLNIEISYSFRSLYANIMNVSSLGRFNKMMGIREDQMSENESFKNGSSYKMPGSRDMDYYWKKKAAVTVSRSNVGSGSLSPKTYRLVFL